jgi:hypothetical protein
MLGIYFHVKAGSYRKNRLVEHPVRHDDEIRLDA